MKIITHANLMPCEVMGDIVDTGSLLLSNYCHICTLDYDIAHKIDTFAQHF